MDARNGNLSQAFIEFCKADCIFKLHTRLFQTIDSVLTTTFL